MPDTRPVYCLLDGRGATPRGLGLDGRTPLGTCRWDDANGKRHGHGLVPCGYDQAAILAELDRKRLARVAAAHPDHRTRTGIHRECPACQARGAHLDHIERGRMADDCAECETARGRAWSAHVGA